MVLSCRNLSAGWADTAWAVCSQFRSGKLASEPPDIHRVRSAVRENLTRFHDGIKRLMNPHEYPVGLEEDLSRKRLDLVLSSREETRKKRDIG